MVWDKGKKRSNIKRVHNEKGVGTEGDGEYNSLFHSYYMRWRNGVQYTLILSLYISCQQSFIINWYYGAERM